MIISVNYLFEFEDKLTHSKILCTAENVIVKHVR